ncbi:NAD(P)-binding domain-containing protein [Pseudonocardia sp. GCM10023141]|uniref:NAD(P)-binding domain-containing protein n=1 Tax=Pseudonocardia sp. GCM10023141 TaxID=3252653 RepID=UPI00360BA03F
MRADVVVVGAGQAGLSAAYGLRRAGLEPGAGFVVLDGEDGPGGAWRHRWPTLRVDDAHRISDLPGLPFAPADPTRPAAEVVPEYFTAYEELFDLQVRRPVHVRSVTDAEPELVIETDAGDWTTRALINATGTWTRPFRPVYPGAETFRGRQLHTVEYRGPAAFAGRRVVVVGGGTSAVQLLLEIAPVAAATTWVTRRPPEFHEGPFDEEVGRAAVARVEERVRAGLPPQSVVGVTGLGLTPAVRAGLASGVLSRRPMFDHITPDGVAWADGTSVAADVILWATGWRAALGHLGPLHLRGTGGGIAMDGTRVRSDPRIHLVGYGPSASTIGANRAGRAAAHQVVKLLGTDAPAPISPSTPLISPFRHGDVAMPTR